MHASKLFKYIFCSHGINTKHGDKNNRAYFSKPIASSKSLSMLPRSKQFFALNSKDLFTNIPEPVGSKCEKKISMNESNESLRKALALSYKIQTSGFCNRLRLKMKSLSRPKLKLLVSEMAPSDLRKKRKNSNINKKVRKKKNTKCKVISIN